MSNTQTLFAALRETADADTAAAIERLVESGADRELARINVLAFAAERGLDEEHAIAAFLHASQLGIFELSWDVLCPTCGGVLDITTTLKDVHQAPYECALCSRSFELSLDEMVEVVFTVSPRLRKIAAHDPRSSAVLGLLPAGILEFRSRFIRRGSAKADRGIHAGRARTAPGDRQRS